MAAQLTEFLNARLDEDEAAAKAAAQTRGDYEWWPTGSDIIADGLGLPDSLHIAAWSPARVLREVEAKRKRLALMVEATAEMDTVLADDRAGMADQAMAVGRARAATVAVKYDAAVYSDHPDYQKDWA